jgi:hypothetical protein
MKLDVRAAVLLILLLAAPGVGFATGPDESERWAPAVGLTVGLNLQDVEGGTSTGNLEAPAFDLNKTLLDCPQRVGVIRCPSSGDGTITAPTLGASLELMTPRLFEGFASPRLFVHGGAHYAFSTRVLPSNEGSVGALTPPTTITQYTEETIDGQGSETEIELDNLMLTAGAGVAFTFETDWRKFRVKPSFEYLREEVLVAGRVHRATALPNALAPIPLIRDPSEQRFIMFSASDDRVVHGIGPGFEIEADAARTGSVVLNVFLGGAAYYFLGDLDINATSTSVTTLNNVETASFEWEIDRWAYRIHAGLRFRWSPE